MSLVFTTKKIHKKMNPSLQIDQWKCKHTMSHRKMLFTNGFFWNTCAHKKNQSINKKKINKMLHADTLSLSLNHVLKLPPSGILLSSELSRNLSPLPRGFPSKIRNIWFSLTQTSRLRNETIYLGKSRNLSRESQNPSRIKAEPQKGTRKHSLT